MNCYKCKIKPGTVDIGGFPYCDDCGSEMTKVLWKEIVEKGAKVVESGETPLGNEQIIPFDMKPPAPEKIKWCGAELIFRYTDGSAVAIRLTPMEQKMLYKKISDNRRSSGSKEMQGMNVMVFDIKTAARLIELVEMFAGEKDMPNDVAVTDMASDLLKEMKS